MGWSADTLRDAFTRFFVDRGHTALPPAGLIPHDPSVLFTIAGMVPFKPYFTGEEAPPAPRVTTVQPCFRTVDIDLVGTTARHATFFEMLGNFSFGDYFKETAIPLAWELVTEVLGFDPERLWVTVHESDADATGIWQDVAKLPLERVQRLGEDNFWKMGDTGPCGPSSEIYFDRGPAYGADGGPASGGDDRYLEIWNLVFMQYERGEDGELRELPRKNIDTGAGLERILALLEGAASVFDTDVIAPVLEQAAAITGHALGSSDLADMAHRILADHSRAMTFLISDGVFPSNEGRGYVLRRIIRRAVLRAHQLGVSDDVLVPLTEIVIATMEHAYPKLARDRTLIEGVVSREEEAFRRTLRAGSALLDSELDKKPKTIGGEIAFKLHDTFGFPIELTEEIATARGVALDRAGFDAEMATQRDRARAAGGLANASNDAAATWRELRDQFGASVFVGDRDVEAAGRVLAVMARSDSDNFTNLDGEGLPGDQGLVDVVLDRTPFYAEGGGQVGDTGTITGPTGTLRVLDTTRVGEGLVRHVGYFVEGELIVGEEVVARIDAERRLAIRRNHTATHLLHDALRAVLGEHVKQQGSLVAPDRLRFDFSHFAGMTPEEIAEVERRVDNAVISDAPVRTYETTRAEAEHAGAIAFFGEKYGEIVRVVEAGSVSVELCGGTHVRALGMIGPFRIISEASIGANTRRIEAITGSRAIASMQDDHALIKRVAETLKATPEELDEAIARLLERQRELDDELRKVRAGQRGTEAKRLAALANDGRVVARVDELDANDLRELALAIRNEPSVSAVGLVGVSEGRVGLAVAVLPDSGLVAKDIASAAAKKVGGGGGGTDQVATAGGRDPAGVMDALEVLGSLMRS